MEITYRGVQKESNQVKVTVVEAKVKPSFEVDPTSINCLSKNTFKFINTSEAADPSLTTYRWDFGDGNIATGFQVTHQYSGVQSYTVRLTASDQLGCSSSFTNTLSVLSSPLKPVVSIVSGSAKFCNGDAVVLSTVVQQPDPKVSFNWYRNKSFLKTTKTITVGTEGDYILEAVNQNGCKDTALIQLATFPLPPTPQLRVAEGYSPSFCEGDSTLLEAVAVTNTGTFKWAALQSSGYVGIAGASTG